MITSKTLKLQLSKTIALEKIYSHHKEFINTIKSLYGNNEEVINYAEDYMQEVYIKLSRYDDIYDKVINTDGSLSKGYVFFAIRSVVLNSLRKKKTIKYSHEGDLFDIEGKVEATGNKAKHLRSHKEVRFISNLIDDGGRSETDINRELIEDKLSGMIDDNIVRTYIKEGTSYRAMAEDRKMGVQCIYRRVKDFKNKVESELGDEYRSKFMKKVVETEEAAETN